MVPAQVGGDELAILGVRDAADPRVGPALIRGEVAVAFGQDAMGHQQLAQVLAPVGHVERVESVVADRHRSGGKGPDALGGAVAAEPRQPAPRHLHGAERVDERHELGSDAAGPVVEEPLEAGTQRAAPALAQGPKVVVGTTAGASKGLGDPAAVGARRRFARSTAGQRAYEPTDRTATVTDNAPSGTRRGTVDRPAMADAWWCVRSPQHTQSPSLLALVGDPGPSGSAGGGLGSLGLGRCSARARRRLDEVVGRAGEDVAQRGQGHERQAFGGAGNQADRPGRRTTRHPAPRAVAAVRSSARAHGRP